MGHSLARYDPAVYGANTRIMPVYQCSPFFESKETLINSEFPQHMDVLPFSVAGKPLKMKNKIKSNFYLVRVLIIHG